MTKNPDAFASFWVDPRVTGLDSDLRLLAAALVHGADDAGRFIADPDAIGDFVFPGLEDPHRIRSHLSDLVMMGFIKVGPTGIGELVPFTPRDVPCSEDTPPESLDDKDPETGPKNPDPHIPPPGWPAPEGGDLIPVREVQRLLGAHSVSKTCLLGLAGKGLIQRQHRPAEDLYSRSSVERLIASGWYPKKRLPKRKFNPVPAKTIPVHPSIRRPLHQRLGLTQ